jgi:ribosomal protein L19E
LKFARRNLHFSFDIFRVTLDADSASDVQKSAEQHENIRELIEHKLVAFHFQLNTKREKKKIFRLWERMTETLSQDDE